MPFCKTWFYFLQYPLLTCKEFKLILNELNIIFYKQHRSFNFRNRLFLCQSYILYTGDCYFVNLWYHGSTDYLYYYYFLLINFLLIRSIQIVHRGTTARPKQDTSIKRTGSRVQNRSEGVSSVKYTNCYLCRYIHFYFNFSVLRRLEVNKLTLRSA